MDQNAPQPENPIIINISEEIINSNFSDTIRMGQNEENANENGVPNESNIYRFYINNFCLFLEPFLLSFKNNQNIENNYNFNELILDLNKLYSKHTGQAVDAIEEALERDNFMSPDEALKFGIIDEIQEKRIPVKTEK